MAVEKMTYSQSGVDIRAGEQVSNLVKSHARRTFGPRVVGQHGGFAGMFRLDYNEKLFKRNYRDPVLVSCTDSVGSKVLLAAEFGVLDSVGQDVVAMNINDLIVQGAEPLFFLDYIGIHTVDPSQVAQIVKGVADGCDLAGCSLIGGETAELPDLYKPGEFDLAGFAVGVCELKRVVDGSRAEPGDIILGLAASGVHSNGFALIRSIIKQRGLDLEHIYEDLDDRRSLGEVLLTPTRIYAKSVLDVLGRYRIKRPIRSMSHITGGGLPGNVMRTLGSHLNAQIVRNGWKVPPVFSFIQREGPVDEEQMIQVFNMGIGYVCIVRPHFADSVIHQLERKGEQVSVIGQIVHGTGRLVME